MDSCVALARALLAASRARWTGVLRVATERGLVQVAVEGGVSRAASALSDSDGALGDALVRIGVLDPGRHYGRLGERERSALASGEWLVSAGLTTRSALERALRYQLRDRLLCLFDCRQHELTFEAGPPDIGLPLVAEALCAEDIVLGALRARVGRLPRERWLGLIPSGELRLTASGCALVQAATLWPEEAVAKALLRHGTTAARVAAATGEAPRAVCFLVILCLLSAATAEPAGERRYSLLVRKREQLRRGASAHELLDLPGGASASMARRALRRLAHRLHPDGLGPGAPDALLRASNEVLGALIGRSQEDGKARRTEQE